MLNMRVGFRFRPSDVEIINYFLRHKMEGGDYLVDEDVREIDLLKYEPWELPSCAAVKEEVLDDQEQDWHFFCRRDSSSRPSRQTGAGYWKSTGRDRVIKDKRTKREIGTKKTLTFHKGRGNAGVRTNWTIHEYLPKNPPTHRRSFVLIKLRKKVDERNDTSACNEGEHPHQLPSDSRNFPVEDPISLVGQELLWDSIDNSYAFQPQSEEDQELTPEDMFLLNGCFDDSNSIDNSYAFQPQSEEDLELTPEDILLLNGCFDDSNVLADSFIATPDGNNYGCSNDFYPQSSVFQPPVTSNTQSRNSNLNKYRHMCKIQTITETLPSSNNGQNRRENNVSHHHEIPITKSSSVTMFPLEVGSEESSSAGSMTDSPKEINFIEPIHEDFSDYVTKTFGIDIPKKGTAPRTSSILVQSSRAVSKQMANKATKHSPAIRLPQKKMESMGVKSKSEKDSKTVPAKAVLKLTTNSLSSFIRMETPPIGHKTSPQLAYVGKILLGLVLFVIVCREMLIFHSRGGNSGHIRVSMSYSCFDSCFDCVNFESF